MHTKHLTGKLRGRKHLEELQIDGSVASSYEHGNELFLSSNFGRIS
jgi:hypothetical protein